VHVRVVDQLYDAPQAFCGDDMFVTGKGQERGKGSGRGATIKRTEVKSFYIIACLSIRCFSAVA
jgi:hypothetical protein